MMTLGHQNFQESTFKSNLNVFLQNSLLTFCELTNLKFPSDLIHLQFYLATTLLMLFAQQRTHVCVVRFFGVI